MRRVGRNNEETGERVVLAIGSSDLMAMAEPGSRQGGVMFSVMKESPFR